jgi:NAD(P)H-dependent flavin oxidoreductase YrpB (nitropropane dioxygenase family)
MPTEDWIEYLELCGWTLARAHARTGDAAQIAGYLGSSESFDEAVAKFAFAYADQTQRDHEMFVKAVRSGRIKASPRLRVEGFLMEPRNPASRQP